MEFISTHTLFTNPPTRAEYDTGSIFQQSLTGLNSEFSLSFTSRLTKAKEISLPYYLPIAGGRIIGYIPFPRVLVLCEMQSSRLGFELVSPCPIPKRITITPQATIYIFTTTHLLNTQKSPVDKRRLSVSQNPKLAVTQHPVKDPQPTLM